MVLISSMSKNMGALAEQYRPLKKLSLGDKENLIIRLVLINIVIFAGLFFVKMVYAITQAPDEAFASQIIPLTVLSADPIQLLTHPWTLFSYMFVHTDFWLLLSCMIWLWGYGELMQGLYGSRIILPLYIFGGLAGAIFFVLAFAFIPALQNVQAVATTIGIGASASVMAIVVSTTMLVPKYRVFPMIAGGIPLYVITLIYLALCFWGKEGSALYGYLAANAGGLLLGAYFGNRIKNGNTPGDFLNTAIYKFSHLFEPKDEIYLERNQSEKSNADHKPFKRVGPVSENRLNELLDKINRNGIQSLTAEEKDILVKASREK